MLLSHYKYIYTSQKINKIWGLKQGFIGLMVETTILLSGTLHQINCYMIIYNIYSYCLGF